jgi:hypothetical protein
MKLRVIRANELTRFIESDWYRDTPMLPITPERARSQVQNPNCIPEDPVLILAIDESDNLLGYLGIVPATKPGKENQRIYYNSCWWVDPGTGRAAAMPLFYKMLELTSRQLIFVELTSQSESVIKTLGGFHHQPSALGISGWFKSGLGYYSGRAGSGISVLFRFIDYGLNVFMGLRLAVWERIYSSERPGISVEQVDMNNTDVRSFIEKYTTENFLSRTTADLDWVLKYPWLSTKPDKTGEAGKYAFSWMARSFKYIPLKIVHGSSIIAFCLITIRDGVCKIPVLYVIKEKEELAARSILNYIVHSGAHALVCWNPTILAELAKTRFPFIRKKQVEKRVAWSEKINDRIPQNWFPMDGDGDAIFT